MRFSHPLWLWPPARIRRPPAKSIDIMDGIATSLDPSEPALPSRLSGVLLGPYSLSYPSQRRSGSASSTGPRGPTTSLSGNRISPAKLTVMQMRRDYERCSAQRLTTSRIGSVVRCAYCSMRLVVECEERGMRLLEVERFAPFPCFQSGMSPAKVTNLLDKCVKWAAVFSHN